MSFCLGFDAGYSNLKTVMGESGKKPVSRLRPSGAGPASKMPTHMSSGSEDTGVRVSIDGEPWVAGVHAGYLEGWVRTLDANYPDSDNYLALYYAALLQTGRNVVDRVVTGLPVSQYQEFERRDRLVQRLVGHHKINSSTVVEVKEVIVLPQPVGAYMNLLSYTDDLELMEEGRVVVLDPGFFSFDWVAMQGRSLRKESSGTSQQAMSRLLEESSRLIVGQFGAGACTAEKLESAIRSGRDKVLVFGQRVEFKPFMRDAMPLVSGQAMAALKQSMREESANGADIVLLAGGGAESYMEAAKEAFPRSKVVVAKNPVMANAEGFWFYGS